MTIPRNEEEQDSIEYTAAITVEFVILTKKRLREKKRIKKNNKIVERRISGEFDPVPSCMTTWASVGSSAVKKKCMINGKVLTAHLRTTVS